MQDFWIDKAYVPSSDWKDFPFGGRGRCVLIKIHDKCDICNTLLPMTNRPGNNTEASRLDSACIHYITYEAVYNNRIKNDVNQITCEIIKARSPKVDSLNDGAKCAGRCGNWNPMAVANQADGSFICYSCRSSF